MEKDDLLKLTAWPEREEAATADALDMLEPEGRES